MQAYDDVIATIGNTPPIKLRRASAATGGAILGKVKLVNPADPYLPAYCRRCDGTLSIWFEIDPRGFTKTRNCFELLLFARTALRLGGINE